MCSIEPSNTIKVKYWYFFWPTGGVAEDPTDVEMSYEFSGTRFGADHLKVRGGGSAHKKSAVAIVSKFSDGKGAFDGKTVRICVDAIKHVEWV